MKRLMLLAAPAVFAVVATAAEAAPVTYNYTAVVDVVVSTPGVAVGDTVTGSFTYDPDNFSVATTSFSANVGTFSLTAQFSWVLIDGVPDEQFLEEPASSTTQFGFFFRDGTGTALSGTSAADVNLDLDAWDSEKVRWNVFDPQTFLLVQGWNGTVTSITLVTDPDPDPVPEPAALALVASALVGLGLSRRRRSDDR